MALEDFFHNLNPHNHKITSNATIDYNCIAWAAGANNRWWDPTENPNYFWPEGIPHVDDVDTIVKVFVALGYMLSQSRDLEPGFEKVAIYGDGAGFTHAARQLPSGKWTSKLGDWEDIEHNNLEALEGEFYGKAVQILKRAVK